MMQKEIAIETIKDLPENATMEEIIYALYLRMETQKGFKDFNNGNIISHEDLMKEIKEW